MRILVTGYKGFIGSNLAYYLQAQGHEVEGWDYIPNTIPDPSSYDWVIHEGAISSTTEKDVDLIIEQNLEYSVRLLQACDMMGTNFQYASSASVYGNIKPTHFTEDGPLYPESPYAWSKYLFDRFVNQHIDDFGVLVQGFRYFNVYGKNGEGHKGNMASPYSKFTQQAKEKGYIELFQGSDNYLRDFVCVEDVCRLHEKMLGVDKSGIWNVGTGSAVSFETVASCIAKKYNADINIIEMPENLKGQYQEFTCANLNKLNSVVDMQWTTIEDYINAAE
jgi:ADP-L-glycero-D-manno-heptose 6-epimerase